MVGVDYGEGGRHEPGAQPVVAQLGTNGHRPQQVGRVRSNAVALERGHARGKIVVELRPPA